MNFPINFAVIKIKIGNNFHKDMVTITEIAANKIIELRQKEGLTSDFNVRVAVEGGGCSGLMYNLDFASQPQTTDMVFEDKGVKIMVDKKSILYLAGTELDFSDGLNGKGFQFKNPNATRTCGCGESFSV
ncbi:iron-sulfur cluster assembly protein [Arcicella sp. BE140]|nr:iron-sulfur cluster assembly protein [Arcicella sp. BE51]MDR6811745.1 iron-sulfur cluster assembly protein [Arcicella sp. BE140]MDR6823270.1 iron-sulfur cluster assembly protein [Arcicella sp. BE139]